MILIGSSAIKHHFPDFNRSPKDKDYIGIGSSCKEVEYLSNPIFDDYPNDVMSPNDLYTLKISHVIGWDVNWDKHMYDIQFLKGKGCSINMELFYKLYNFWNEYHGKNNRSDLY